MKLISTIRTKILYNVTEKLKLPPTEILEGSGACEKIGNFCKRNGYSNALVITDKDILEINIPYKMLKSLEKAGISYNIYDGVLPNPTINMSKEASIMGKKNKTDIIIFLLVIGCCCHYQQEAHRKTGRSF